MKCLICNSSKFNLWSKAKDYEYKTSDDIYQYLVCSNCGILQISDFPVDHLSKIYPKNYYSFVAAPVNFVSRFKEYLDLRLFKKILKNVPGNELAVLDIGGGVGRQVDLLKSSSERVKTTQIIDLDESAMLIATSKGHSYFCGKFEDFDSDIRYDIILMLNIIEHVSNPMEMLRRAKSLLNQGGCIVIKTPNTDSFDAKLFRGSYWGGLHAPRHWVLFNGYNMTNALKNAGLQVSDLKFTQGASFWAWSIVSFLDRRGLIEITKDSPIYSKNITILLTAIFAAIDFLLTPTKKTSQIIVLAKNA